MHEGLCAYQTVFAASIGTYLDDFIIYLWLRRDLWQMGNVPITKTWLYQGLQQRDELIQPVPAEINTKLQTFIRFNYVCV